MWASIPPFFDPPFFDPPAFRPAVGYDPHTWRFFRSHCLCATGSKSGLLASVATEFDPLSPTSTPQSQPRLGQL